MRSFVKFKQNDMEGHEHVYTESFENNKARKNFIRQLKMSSKYLNLPFEVIEKWEK